MSEQYHPRPYHKKGHLREREELFIGIWEEATSALRRKYGPSLERMPERPGLTSKARNLVYTF